MNEYDDLLASEGTKDEARTNLRASVIGALPTNPDQYAEAKRLAKSTGVPAPVVERNMDEVKKQATLNEYDSLIERAPVTASKFQDQEFAKLAHDERDQLAHLEGLIGSAPRPEIYGSVLTPTGRGVFSPAEQPQPTQPPVELDPNKVRGEMLRRFGFKGASIIDRKIDGALANGTQAQLVPWDGKTREFGYDDATRKGVAMVKLTWDFLADQLAGAMGMDQTETRRIMADTQQYMQALGKDFDTELAMELARERGGDSVVGVLGALPDAIGATDNPFDVVGKFATEQLVASSGGSAIGSAVAAPLRRSAMAHIANQAIARSVGVALTGASASSTAVVLQSLGSNYQEGLGNGLTPDEAGRRAWIKTLAEVPANALAGALVGMKVGPNQITNILAQTGVQAAAGGVGAASASLAVGEKIDPLEIALEIAGEGVGAVPDMVFSGAMVPARIVSRKLQMEREAQVKQATAAADHLTKIMLAAEASKTRLRDPETFAQLVQDAAEASGTAPTEVFIDAQPQVDILHKAGMTEAQIREALPSVAEQLGTEYTTGGTVAIPIGEAVAAFAGTGAEADLVRFARTTEDGYSVADSEQALAALEEMDADAQRIIAEQQDADAWAQSAQAVEDTLFAQLEGAGRFSSDVNRTYATILRNYYVTQADVMGITPEALYKQFPLTVSGVAPTGQVLNSSPTVEPKPTAFDLDATEDALILERDSFAWVRHSDRTPLQRIIYAATAAPVIDATSPETAEMFDSALENGRLDLAQYIATRARRAADSMLTTPGVSEDSPKYAAIKADLEARKAAAQAAAADIEKKLAERMGQQGGRVDEATGLPLNSDGTVTVYHHTSAENAARIRETGVLQSAGEPDVYLTTRRQTDTGYGDTAVPVRINPALLALDDEFPDGRRDFRASVGKPGGSMAVTIGEADADLNQSTAFDQEVNGTTPYTADTIEVDGKTRPAVNNKGQRIAQTEEGLVNFWRWFGDSKVVDAEGRPLVVYHGSDEDIEVFKTDGQGKTSGAGAFFTSNPAVASTYTQPARGGNISPVYLKIESAAELDAADSNWNRLGEKTKVSLPAVEVSDQADENLLAELEGREPAAGVTKKLKARKTTLGKLFPDEFVYDDDFASTDDIARWARKQGYDGLTITNVVDRGPSGRMHTKEAADPGALFVAFTNTQIKSIFNRGTYDGSDPNTLNQSAYSDGPRLSAIHNLSAENLIFADKMGGIAVPSIGVVTEDAGGVDGFGEITLIGTKNLADPRGEPVFSSDAYTTRFPKPEWGKVKRKDADKLVAEIRPVAEEFDDRIVTQETFDGMVNKPDAAEVIHRWLSSNAIKAMFLREQGIEAKPVKREANFDTGLSQEQIESLDADYDEVMAAWRNGDREAPVVEATRAKVRAMAEVNAKAEGLSGKLLEEYLDAISDGFPRNLFNDRAKIRNGFGVDTWKTREALQADIDARAAEFKAWVEAKVLPPFGDPFIKVGREKRPYTLPNIVEVMTDSKVKGKEKTMTYGPGMVRAVTSKQFSGIEEMRAAAKDAIADPAEYEVAKKGSEAALEAYRDAVVPYTTYTDWRGAPDTWEALDSSMRALAKWATGKKRDAAGMRSALRKEGFKVDALSADTIELAITAGNALLNAPVPYFEAKPQRAVSLGEFAGAVIPANTSPDVRAILDKNGIPYREVVEGTDRQSLVREFTSELSAQGADTLFQNQPSKAEARGSFNPTTLNIALLEKADLSTFLHETGHFFFEMQVTIAARPDAPARIVNDVAILLKEVGFTGTAAEWLAQPLDARREAHEKVAESFEQYLITGDAPTVELQGLFNQMRAWMLAVYKTLKQFFAVNKRAGLSAEVAGVFDRMLASDAAIAETKRVRAMSPLFTSAEAAGMTAEEWTAYQADAGQMDADARRDLDARQVRDMKWLRSARGKALKVLQADASAKRREARIEARRRLLQEPVYRAMQFLRGKVEKAEVEKKAKGLDTRRDDLLTAIAKLGGLNKDLVVAEWGIDPKDFAKSPVFGKPILRGGKAGMSPDGMGEALAEVGYLQPKDGDRYSLADFEAMFNDAARGVQHYSLDADYDLIHGYKTLPVSADLGEQPFAAGRLSRPDLEARFGGTDVDWQALGVGRRGMIAEVGMDADAVANIVGFNTGEEMVKALLAAEPLQDATEALTDQIMLERYGDITSPEGLQRAADEALANDAHAKLLATEYARLNKAVGSPRAVQLAAKEAAERTVDRQAVRLARPEKATAAAARAGKAAEKAHAAGNLDEAAGFKRNQILNTAIARAQRELRAFVDKAKGDFAKMFGKDAQLAKTRDMNLVNLARAALAQYRMGPEGGAMKALRYLNLVADYDPPLAANLESMLNAMPEGKDYRDLTAGEFRTVASLVRGMWEMSRGVKQITIDGKKVEIDAAADELVAAVTANNGGKQGVLPGYSGTTTTADDLRVGALGIKSMLTRVEQWADYMGPAFKRFIWQPVSEAVTRYRVRRNEMVKQYRDLLKTIEPDLTFHKIHAPELGAAGFTFNGGKSEVLHAILHSGNKSNLRKLLLGPGHGNPAAAWATVDAEGNVDTSRWDAFVRRMAAEGVITRNDMDFVQGVWDLLETVKGDAQKAHRELYGYYFNEVTATPFVDPFGVERRGGYVPALADGLSSPDAMQKREQEELLHAGNSFMFPSTGKGFTQSRVEYNRPLELDLRTIGSHLDKVTRFAYIEPAVRDVGKLLLNKRVSRALNGYDQTIISQMLNPWLQRAARQTISVPGKNRWADKFFNGLRSRSGVVIMFANVVNTLQQITGFSVAALKVPAPMLLRATYRMMTEPKRMSAEAAALSPWLAERMAGQSFEMQQEIKNILVNPNPLVKGNEFLKHNAYFLQQAMQNMMDPIIWWGAYDNATANGANQRDAIRAGDEAVRTTQGTFAPEDVSAFESNTAFVRLFTQFYGYFNMLANTLGLEAKKAIRDMGYGAATPRLLFIWFAGLALPAVVAEIIARGLPDDEDDEDGDGVLDEWLTLFFGSQFRTLAAMAPGAGQGVSLAVNLTDDKVYNDRLSISPGVSMAETTVRGGVNLLQGEVLDERLTKAEVRDTLTLIGMATGAPTGPLARSAGYLVDVENGRADPENPVEFAVGLTTGR